MKEVAPSADRKMIKRLTFDKGPVIILVGGGGGVEEKLFFIPNYFQTPTQ